MNGSAVPASGVGSPSLADFSQRPMLVFWETTRACLVLPGQRPLEAVSVGRVLSAIEAATLEDRSGPL